MNIVARVEGELDGITNMARDAALLEENQPVFRVYGWDGAWVSLGRSQASGRVIREGCQVPTVLRPSGGKAVLHGHDVTLGLAAPLTALGFHPETRSIGPVYRRIIQPIVAALQSLEIPAELGENTRFVKSEGKTADCFAHVAPNDVVHPQTGQKVCGCALRLTGGSVLVQASLPAGPPLIDPRQAFDQPHHVAWSPGLNREDFASALKFAWEKLSQTWDQEIAHTELELR